MTKQFPFLYLVALLFAIILLGCNKSGNHSTTKNSKIITEAKDYFEKEILQQPQVTSLSPEETYLQRLGRKVLWDRAYLQKIDEGIGVVVPIKYNGDIFIKSNESNNMVYSLNNLSKLLIYKDSNGSFQTQVINGYPTSSYLLSQTSFRGIITTKTWQGELLKQYKVTDQGILIAAKPSFGPSGTSSGVQVQSTFIKNCNVFYGYNFAPSDPTNDYSYTQETCVTYYLAGPGSSSPGNGVRTPISVIGSGGPPPGGGGGGGGGDGTTYVAFTPGVNDIEDSLKNKCWKSLFLNLSPNPSNLQSELSNILVNTFGSTDEMTYTIKQDADTSHFISNEDAHTRKQIKGPYVIVTTTLNSTKLANASKEFVMETVFHELLHAELNVHTNIRDEMQQHCEMIYTYVACEMASLQTYFTTLSSHDALCMILGGFAQVQQFDNTTFTTVLANYGLTENDVYTTNISYLNGSSGTKCPPIIFH